MDYTLVLGVDRKHIGQLSHTWETWVKNKPSIADHPILVFYDHEQVTSQDVCSVIKSDQLDIASWPISNVKYTGEGTGKWDDPQRYKMLSGFVHIPARFVNTPYWLKIDTDVVALPGDPWVDPDWFVDEPAIISQPWGYTKPPHQMMDLDCWAIKHELFPETSPLSLVPEPGSNKVKHRRIISWCSFFKTSSTIQASKDAERTCGPGLLPVPSQDGYVWYHATRSGEKIRTVDMKARGWKQRNNLRSIIEAAEQAMS